MSVGLVSVGLMKQHPPQGLEKVRLNNYYYVFSCYVDNNS